ncbi:RagB/SusD family nutrient uptake outer membrane protein [uncultured Mucilaginibacter sp.]|uniref:RagB/SusD family nutrient uptake outer membrane protein n=1 Tax=uncultured Mucilaginibacter sp. TaxID=797541 RepID=UPI0025EC81C1|nr:RagB/SusD family nutrient uptake outer membrane protein [uncultured Mucilaginibacter sp.]
MKIRFTPYIKAAALVVMLTGSYSCRNMYDVEPQNQVDAKNMFRNIYDADAAVIGIYGKVLSLARQYEVLNELRADLMDVTPNAGAELQQINTHNVLDGNSFADPKPFYSVILSCNDVMKNLKLMYDTNKLTANDYNQRWSDVAALRSWLYFQLGIHFGEVPYVTEALTNVNDVKDQSKYPRLKLDALVRTLITFLEALPYKLPYPAANTMITQIDGYPSKLFFVNKKCLLGDLYLWNNEYRKAATVYKEVLETSTPNGPSDSYNYFNTYTLNSGSDNDAVTTSAWQGFLSRSMQDREFQSEWIWAMVFDKAFAPENPFINLFANNGGQYLVKPSQTAIDNWNSQIQNDGTPFDLRGPNNTYKIINGQPVIVKFLYNYLSTTTGLPVNALENNGRWFLYRTPTLHLRYAEAANRDGQTKIAWALVNAGIKGAYDNTAEPDATKRRITNLPEPYMFDARKLDAPTIRGKYHRNLGIRARVGTINLSVAFQNDMVGMEDKLLEEAALELAYEGNRWQDLMRVALRRNDPALLADKVYNKLLKDGNPAAASVRSRLMNTANWFLPFK